jgi:hypothetical protein
VSLANIGFMESASRPFFVKLCSVHPRRLAFLLVGLSLACLISGCAPYIAAELVFAGARAIAENAQNTPRSLGQTSATEDDNQQATKERERLEAEKFQLAAVTQSQLPECRSAYKHNCFGTTTFSSGSKYVGEFKDGKVEGQGTATYANGDKFVGEWRDDLRNGQGIEYRANGTIIRSGRWAGGTQAQSFGIDSNRFPFNAPTQTASAQPSTAERDRLAAVAQSLAVAEAQRKERERLEAEKFHRAQQEQLKVAASQRLENELKAAKLEENLIRLARERDQVEADKLQREQQEILKLAQQEALQVQYGKRIALVMGNSKYIHRPLKNPINDANDVSRALKSANFEVIDIREATLTQMRSAVRQFGDKLLKNDVGLVYYSGHGVEVKGKNYFIPVNADIQREDEVVDQSLDVSLILEKMTTAGKGVNILIVDACRDDPFGRSFRSASKGLATMDAPTGTIIAYATSPGRVASDGYGRNSPYTKALVKAMQTPNKPIELVFKEVRRAVREETKNQQTPWENTSLSGDFYFRIQK